MNLAVPNRRSDFLGGRTLYACAAIWGGGQTDPFSGSEGSPLPPPRVEREHPPPHSKDPPRNLPASVSKERGTTRQTSTQLEKKLPFYISVHSMHIVLGTIVFTAINTSNLCFTVSSCSSWKTRAGDRTRRLHSCGNPRAPVPRVCHAFRVAPQFHKETAKYKFVRCPQEKKETKLRCRLTLQNSLYVKKTKDLDLVVHQLQQNHSAQKGILSTSLNVKTFTQKSLLSVC